MKQHRTASAPSGSRRRDRRRWVGGALAVAAIVAGGSTVGATTVEQPVHTNAILRGGFLQSFTSPVDGEITEVDIGVCFDEGSSSNCPDAPVDGTLVVRAGDDFLDVIGSQAATWGRDGHVVLDEPIPVRAGEVYGLEPQGATARTAIGGLAGRPADYYPGGQTYGWSGDGWVGFDELCPSIPNCTSGLTEDIKFSVTINAIHEVGQSEQTNAITSGELVQTFVASHDGYLTSVWIGACINPPGGSSSNCPSEAPSGRFRLYEGEGPGSLLWDQEVTWDGGVIELPRPIPVVAGRRYGIGGTGGTFLTAIGGLAGRPADYYPDGQVWYRMPDDNWITFEERCPDIPNCSPSLRLDLQFAVTIEEFAVVDATAPEISVPDPIVVGTDWYVDTAVVGYEVVATDDIDGPVPVECTPPSGSAFPFGTTDVVCTAVDAAGNEATASFSVTVIDTIGPSITFPGDRTLFTDAGQPTALWEEPDFHVEADDNVAVASLDCSHTAPYAFPIGETVVSCTATDTSGNSTSTSFRVTVVDVEAPVLGLPEGVVVTATGLAGAVVVAPVDATDNSGVVTVTCDPGPGTVFPLGESVVSCLATDPSGNIDEGTFTVRVVVDEQSIGTLVDAIPELGLIRSIERHLVAKLASALGEVEGGRVAHACRDLAHVEGFVADQLVEGRIDAADAEAIVGFSTAIREILNC